MYNSYCVTHEHKVPEKASSLYNMIIDARLWVPDDDVGALKDKKLTYVYLQHIYYFYHWTKSVNLKCNTYYK